MTGVAAVFQRQILLLVAFVFLIRANSEESVTLRRKLVTTLQSGYFNTLTYTDPSCVGFLATAKVQLLGVCYKSLNGYTLNTAFMDFPSSGIATLNSTYYADAQCLHAAIPSSESTSTAVVAKSTASTVPMACTVGVNGVGGYYTRSTVTPTVLEFPASSCSLVTRAYRYSNCSGPIVQTNFYALNLCLQGITKYSCAGTAVTASVCGKTAFAVTSTCQPSANGFAQTDAPYEASACSNPSTCTNFNAPSTSPTSQGSCGTSSQSCIYISSGARTKPVAWVATTVTAFMLIHWMLY
jgi:hypothetical protein